jgi:type IV pilus assembly protein PilA
MKKFFKYGNKGFTLIELLVVIAILGTLAAVVILNVTKYIGAGETQANLTDKANIQTAVAAYMYDHTGGIPAGPITPASYGDISEFVLNPPKCSYTVNQSTGAVTQISCP